MQDLEKIKIGLDSLLSYDGYLLENNVSERAITHKLAEHYQKLFPEWNVDCEYNRNLGKLKEIDVEPKKLLSQMADFLDSETGYSLSFKHYLQDISEDEIIDLKRQLRDPKIEYIPELDLFLFLLQTKEGEIKKTIYPDIIIHHRGTSENNIVVEAKKTNNGNIKARHYDLSKLATLITEKNFKYKKGIFVDFPVEENFKKFRSFARSDFRPWEVYQYLPKYQ